MLVSKKSKALLLRFLLGRGGYITSGRNASLLRWLFEKIANETYTHERVGEVERLVEAVERDGNIVLERDERGKMFSITLANRFNPDLAELDENPFQTLKEWANATVVLRARLAEALNQPGASDATAAFELAEQLEHQLDAVVAQLAEATAQLATRTDSAAAERHVVELESELAGASTEIIALQQRNAVLREKLAEARTTVSDKRQRLLDRLSQESSRNAGLERKLVKAGRAVEMTQAMSRALIELCIDNGVDPTNLISNFPKPNSTP